MGDFFKPDSPLAKLMTLVANFVCLNVLWLLCCIPVVTAGAATAAMYHVLLQYITRQDDAVLKPFFQGFRDNFRTATLIWIPQLLIAAVIVAEGFYAVRGGSLMLMIFYGIQLVLFAGISAYLYPLAVRYDNPVRRTVLNSFLLALRHLGNTLLTVIVNAVPIVLLLLYPEYIWGLIPLWLLGGFALLAYLNCRILMPVFRQYEPEEPEDEAV